MDKSGFYEQSTDSGTEGLATSFRSLLETRLWGSLMKVCGQYGWCGPARGSESVCRYLYPWSAAA